jgi:hypothetical protein
MGLDQKDALHVRTCEQLGIALDLPEDVLRRHMMRRIILNGKAESGHGISGNSKMGVTPMFPVILLVFARIAAVVFSKTERDWRGGRLHNTGGREHLDAPRARSGRKLWKITSSWCERNVGARDDYGIQEEYKQSKL